jgi:hypothetical protein
MVNPKGEDWRMTIRDLIAALNVMDEASERHVHERAKQDGYTEILDVFDRGEQRRKYPYVVGIQGEQLWKWHPARAGRIDEYFAGHHEPCGDAECPTCTPGLSQVRSEEDERTELEDMGPTRMPLQVGERWNGREPGLRSLLEEPFPDASRILAKPAAPAPPLSPEEERKQKARDKKRAQRLFPG